MFNARLSSSKDGNNRYSQDEIDALPANVRKEAKIRRLAKRGTTQAEKEYACRVRVAVEEKGRQKRKRGADMLDVKEMQAKAKKAKTDHERTWHNKEERTYFDVVEKVATKSHFTKVQAKTFHTEIEKVLPFLKPEELLQPDPKAPGTKKKKTKTKLMETGGVIGTHLALIKSIAKKEVPNTLNDTDLSDMDYNEVLAEFVKAKESESIKEIELDLAQKWKKLQNIFKSAAGTKMSTYFDLKLNDVMEDETDDLVIEDETDAMEEGGQMEDDIDADLTAAQWRAYYDMY